VGHVRLTDFSSAVFNSNTVKIKEVDRFDMMCDRNTEPYRARELHLRLELRLIIIPAEPRTSSSSRASNFFLQSYLF
jgi:hypothetical protein